jgi:hypothetical protein
MIDGKPVIAWTPYGRAKTVSILIEYMKRDHDKGVLDAYWLFLNCDPDQVDDLRYAYELAEQHPWIHLKERPAGLPFRTPKQRNTGAAYRHMTDPDAVYVRFDDDIIYVHEDMLTNLVRAKIAMTGTLCAFALCWNNAIVSWFEQQVGNIPREFGVVERPFCMDPVGWASGRFRDRDPPAAAGPHRGRAGGQRLPLPGHAAGAPPAVLRVVLRDVGLGVRGVEPAGCAAVR